ncbi:BspA family leucine-rich repeat surface protein [Enterococcus hirae]|nr:BspA family leucine-rich repeat surface protein [Enterococcus hirae]
MFAVAGVMGNTGIAPTMALADTLTPTAETATEQTQANEAKEVIDQTIQNVTDPLVNPTDSTTTASDSLATTDETTDDTQDQATEQEQATAPTAESEGDATNPTAEAPKVAKKANVVAASEITGTWGTSPYTFDENTGVLTIGAGELSGYTESPWSENKNVDAEAIKKIVLSGKVVAPKNSRLLFSGNTPAEKLTNVTEIEGLSQLDTSNVTDMSYMFFGMSSVTSLDVSSFDTSNVTTMSYMFYGMSSVTGLDVSNFDTSNVTTMGYMFKGMGSVTSLDLSNFDTSNVTDMTDMFFGTSLKKLILGDTFKFVAGKGALTSAWKREDGKGKAYTAADFMKNYGTGDLTAGTYVSVETGTWGTSPYIFDENTGVLTIEAGELSGYEESPWNSDKVDSEAIKKIVLAGKVVAPEDSAYLFSSDLTGSKYLNNLTEIEGLNQLDTSNVTNMREMFKEMSNLTSLDVSGFDTSNVTTMENMFYNISSVTSLDLSVFDTSNVTTMQDMFKDTPLAKLTLGDHFKAVGDTKLSAPKALNEGDQLTGNWIREDGQSKGYSPADFMTNYGTGDLTAGTYVAELVKSELKPQEYHVGDVNITGTYTGDMSLGRLTVNGKVVSWGGSFKDGKFSYYVGNLKVSEDDQVVLMGANNRGQQIPGSEIDVTIQTPTAEINELTYKIGTQTIKGAYGSDTQVHQGHLFVNGKLISKGGSFKDGAISYYVKPDLIKADDQVTMNFYDGSGNLLAENQTVSVN